MNRGKLVIGNWKMNPEGSGFASKIFKAIAQKKPRNPRVELVICPPFVYLKTLSKLSKKVVLGAQNIYFETSGAYTGEVSAGMVYDAGARYVILGHSERRAMGESDKDINRKVKTAISEGLKPVLCVGEKERDKNHEYFKVIENQLEEALDGIFKTNVESIVIAYEPVWAIGKEAAREATPEEFREISVLIRKFINDKFGRKNAMSVKILYGGSVNTKNAELFITEGEADGFLVGRASLKPERFLEIFKFAGSEKRK